MAEQVARDHILSEIQRLAERDGTSPGRGTFEKETGIKETDVSRYWATWGEAVREAGFEPNTLQAAYEDDYLLKKLAELSLKLGRIPTGKHIAIAARQDDGFPAPNTFNTHFGGKVSQIRRLLAYCAGDDRYVQAEGYCEAWLAQNGPSELGGVEADGDGAAKWGFVYLMKSGRHHKIGLSVNPVQRGAQLATGSSGPIEVIHCIKTDDMHGIERYWHQRFADKRVHGEWFNLTIADVKAFMRRKRFM